MSTLPAGPVVVASDLDRTLIYSPGALGLDVPDDEAPRLLCVEVYEGRPLSFMTETAASLLRSLTALPGTVFVPTTTRTRAQYRRVHLPCAAPPAYAVCANGGHLLVDGETDPGWHAHVTRRIADACAPLEDVHAHLLARTDPAWLSAQRVAEDLFVYLVVERNLLPAGWVEDLTAWAAPRGWTVSLQGRKVYAVPAPLTKGAALAEVARRTGASLTAAAGDSLLDADLLLAADRAWRPGHGELADTGWTAAGVTALAETGVRAGEELVRRFLDTADRGNTHAGPAGAPGAAHALADSGPS